MDPAIEKDPSAGMPDIKKKSPSIYLTCICIMAISGREPKGCAALAGLPQVYHDCDADVNGACEPGETRGIIQSRDLY
ncbi:MAG: hypothetical protein LUQ36_02055 [Methanoregula sp.]|nr:hypothetical protein [Methanoregula sp.]